MPLKDIHYGFLLLFCLGYLSSDFASSRLTEGVRVRQKRSFICIFGLTSVLRDAVYVSLGDVQKYDPLELGNTEDCSLEDGILRGLSSLTNLTELNVYCTEDRIIVLATTLGMSNADILYHWTRKFLFTLSGTIWMRAKEVNFELEVHMNTTGGLRFKVVNSLLTKLEDFHFGFTGLGPLNPVVKGTVNLMYKVWRRKVTSKIETLLGEALENKLQEIAHTIDFLIQF